MNLLEIDEKRTKGVQELCQAVERTQDAPALKFMEY